MKSFFFLVFLYILLFFSLTALNAQERGIESLEYYLDKNVIIGKQYVFFIAINKYKEWDNLGNPVRDARKIKNILESRYFIDEIIELYDESATRDNIIDAFYGLQQKLTHNDSLLIFFGGHGFYNKEVSETGYVIPHDGEKFKKEETQWISNMEIRNSINDLRAMHVLLINDSCYSGDILDLSRVPDNRPVTPMKPYIIKALNRRSRQAITSGAYEIVPDNSEVADRIIEALLSNNKQFFESGELYDIIKQDVNESLPLFGILKETKHEAGGTYYFFLKDGTLPPEPGWITIKSLAKGRLYIDSYNPLKISPGEYRIDAVVPGHYSMTMIYSDGHEELLTAEVDEQMGTEVTFTYIPPPKKNYFMISAGTGLTLPLFFWGDVLQTGYNPSINLLYTLKSGPGRFTLGFVTGTIIESLKENLDGAFTIFAFPIGISTGYEFEMPIRLCPFVQVAGGIVINYYDYETQSPDTPTISPSVFAHITGGICWKVMRYWGISLYAQGTGIFFNTIPYYSISPGVRCEIYFR